MGLDMYLTKKVFVGAEYEHRGVTGTIDIKVGGEPLPIDFNKVSYIEESIAYWRKANAIHKWFVDECQDGVDECQNTYVPIDKLMELLEICKTVKKNHHKAPELLPTQSGISRISITPSRCSSRYSLMERVSTTTTLRGDAMDEDDRATYLGDGVYAGYDGYQIYIWTWDGIKRSPKIAIEDYTLLALIAYAKKIGMIGEKK